MKTTKREESDFVGAMHSYFAALLEVTGDYIGENFVPGDVFSESDLETWALENGFVRAEE